MIAEAAYYLAQKRGFPGEHALDDWLAAEQQVRDVISPMPSEVTMSNQTEPSELVSVDETIDAIAREALEEARRMEEAERYRSIPGPIVSPQKPVVAP